MIGRRSRNVHRLCCRESCPGWPLALVPTHCPPSVEPWYDSRRLWHKRRRYPSPLKTSKTSFNNDQPRQNGNKYNWFFDLMKMLNSLNWFTNLLTYMRVFSFGPKTPPSQDSCIHHCYVGFPWYYDQRRWSSMIYFFYFCCPLREMVPNMKGRHPCMQKGINKSVSTI